MSKKAGERTAWSHPRLTECTEEEIFAELYYTKRIIKQVTGYSSRCFRPPYGDIDDRVRRIAAALELHPVMWNTETADCVLLSLAVCRV